jgi:Na+/melibiose symporter-like transporter
MLTTLIIFIAGGLLLNASAESGNAWLGFAVLFGCAALGRFISALLLWRMHDPEPDAGANAMRLRDSWLHIKESLRDPAFRRYSLFVASLQGAVAVSAPFFAVYMLRDLQFTYLQFSINSVASIATQFLLLRFWGRFSDRFGNHLVMVICAASIPLIPILWMLSEHPYYLIVVQIISGVFWSGFTLSTANYLYDIRPHQTNFALYAAIQSGTSALAVCIGGIFGGLLASSICPANSSWCSWQPLCCDSPSLLIFCLSSRSPHCVSDLNSCRSSSASHASTPSLECRLIGQAWTKNRRAEQKMTSDCGAGLLA